MEDLTGKQLGQYQIVGPIGEGGMAAVYKAYQPAMERYVALKILPRQYASDPKTGVEFVGRFEQEAKVIAQLQHQNILPVFDFGEADGYTYLVMPFVESGTLAELLHGQPLPLPQIRRIFSQVGEALHYAHSHGLVHRDVKPSNVLIDESGNCQLTDFGIAKIVAKTAKFTRTGGIIGTPAYMSPEQGRGNKVIDGRSDIYSFGVMLYEMAVGRVPFDAETPIAVIFKHIDDPLPLPRNINPELPEAVERVILKSLAKQPEDRYATAGQMVHALRAAIPESADSTSETVIEPQPTAPPAPTPAPVEPPSKRSNLRWILATVGIVTIMAVVIAIGAGALGNGTAGTLEPNVVVITVDVTPTPVTLETGDAEIQVISSTPDPNQQPTTTPSMPPSSTATTSPNEYVEGETLFESDFEDGKFTGWSSPSLERVGWQVTQDDNSNYVFTTGHFIRD